MKLTDDNKIIIGVTGGAGSGKSTIVGYIISNYDAEFIHCDDIAKKMMEPGGLTYDTLIAEYGKGILGENGLIQKDLLTKAVTESKEGFERLNALTHPLVTKEVVRRANDSQHRFVLIEAALLIESGIGNMCDDVWFIYATREERIRRIKCSRDWSDEKIETLLNNQLSDEQFKAGSTFIVENHDGSAEWKKDVDDRLNNLDSNIHNC